MNPTEFQKSKSPLTGARIIADMKALGADRASLVRPADGAKGAAIAVFLLSQKAIREVGPYLRDVFMEFRQDGQPNIVYDGASNIGTIIEAVEETPFRWIWSSEMPGCGLFIILTGAIVTHELANELTKRRCITNLK